MPITLNAEKNPLNELEARLSRTANSPEGTVRLAVFAAAREHVESQGKETTPSTVAAALVQSFDSEACKTENICEASLYLLGFMLKHVQAAVLRQHFAEVVGPVTMAINHHKDSSKVARSACGVIAALLVSQPSSAWRGGELEAGISYIISSSIDTRPKVRHAANDALANLLERERKSIVRAITRPSIRLVRSVCRDGPSSEKLAHALGLAGTIFPYLSDRRCANLLLVVSQFARTDGPNAHAAIAAVSVALQSSGSHLDDDNNDASGNDDAEEVLPAKALQKCLEHLVHSRPPTENTRVVMQWMLSVSLLAARLAVVDRFAACDLAAAAVQSTHDYVVADANPRVFKAAAKALDVIHETVVSDAPELRGCSEAATQAMVLLTPVYKPFWISSIPIVTAFVNSSKNKKLAQKLVSTLLSLRVAGDMIQSKCDHALAEICGSFGAEFVLETLPIVDAPCLDEGIVRAKDIRNDWMLSVLKMEAQVSAAQWFSEFMIPLYDSLMAGSEAAVEEKLMVEAANLRALATQVWMTAPRICSGPATEIAGVMPVIMLRLEDMLKSNSVDVNSTCQMLIRMSDCLDHGDNAAAVQSVRASTAKFGKKIVQTIIDLAEDEAPIDVRAQLMDSAAALLRMCDPAVANGMLKSSLKKALKQSTQGLSTADALEKVMVCVRGNGVQDSGTFNVTVQAISPMLAEQDDKSQKKAYKSMIVLLDAHPSVTGEAWQAVRQSVLEASEMTATVARPLRLRVLAKCLELELSKHQPTAESFSAVLAEILLGCKDPSRKARQAAIDALSTIVEHADPQEGNMTGLRSILGFMAAGLAGSTTAMISSTVVGLTRMVFLRKERALEACPGMMDAVIMLLKHHARDIISSVIGFVKVSISVLDRNTTSVMLPNIIPLLLGWTDEAKKRFRRPIQVLFERCLKKFDAEEIEASIPEEHKKFWTAILKRRRRQRRKGDRDGDDSENEEDWIKGDDGEGAGAEDAQLEEDLMSSTLKSALGKVMAGNGKKVGKKQTASSSDSGVATYDGKIVLTEEGIGRIRSQIEAEARHMLMEMENRKREENDEGSGKKRRRGDDDEEDGDISSLQWGQTFKNKMRTKSGKRAKGVDVEDGQRFKAKKGAGGDRLKAGDSAPYAYIPLDRGAAKRGRDKNVIQAFNTVQKTNRKGSNGSSGKRGRS